MTRSYARVRERGKEQMITPNPDLSAGSSVHRVFRTNQFFTLNTPYSELFFTYFWPFSFIKKKVILFLIRYSNHYYLTRQFRDPIRIESRAQNFLSTGVRI